jgi:hypothetical protein
MPRDTLKRHGISSTPALEKNNDNSLPQEMMSPDGVNRVSGKQEVISMLNSHFTTIGERTAPRGPPSPSSNSTNTESHNFSTYLPSPSQDSMFLSPVTEQELISIIKLLKKWSFRRTGWVIHKPAEGNNSRG